MMTPSFTSLSKTLYGLLFLALVSGGSFSCSSSSSKKSTTDNATGSATDNGSAPNHSLSAPLQFGSSSSDIAYGIATDSSDNLYVVGKTYAAWDGNTNAGEYDVFLTKVSPSGVRQWTQQLGSSADDIPHSIAIDASDNIYVSGDTSGGLDGNTNQGNLDVFLVKYNPSGAKQWTQQLGTSSDDYNLGMGVDALGNVYLHGRGGDFDNSTNKTSSYFIAKYNSSGVKQWIKPPGNYFYGWRLRSQISVDPSGNVYFTGWKSQRVGVVAKYNSSGVKQWSQDLGGGTAYGIALDSSGEIYVTGWTSSNLDGNANAGGRDAFIMKLDSSGTKQWTQLLGTTSNDRAYSIAVDSSNGIYITGSTEGSLDGSTYEGKKDLFVVKYDSSGVKQWTQQRGTVSDEEGFDLSVDSQNNVFVTGGTGGSLEGNKSSGNWDAFILKYDSNGVKLW